MRCDAIEIVIGPFILLLPVIRRSPQVVKIIKIIGVLRERLPLIQRLNAVVEPVRVEVGQREATIGDERRGFQLHCPAQLDDGKRIVLEVQIA